LVKQIVLASSDKAYGQQASLPYRENTPLEGRHPYDVSKSCADLIAQAYARSYALPVTVTRCGNFYGGGDLNWSRLVPDTIRSVCRGRPPVIRSNGTPIRDYFYIEDGAAAYMLLAERLAADSDLAGQAFNFSSELPISALEMVRRILNRMDVRLEPEIRYETTNEIPHQFLSAEKARMRLGWKPLFDLDTGLDRTIAWYREYFAQQQARRAQAA
jgi:CDP-glucose 4,6-dehydratase